MKKEEKGEQLFYELWADHSAEGLILIRKKDDKIQYYNAAACRFFDMRADDFPGFISALLNRKQVDALRREKIYTCRQNGKSFEFTLLDANDKQLVIVQDITQVETIRKKLEESEQMNKALRTVYEQNAEDTIFIADHQGCVEFVDATIPYIGGVSPEYIKSKTMYELEAEKIFYPSVTVRVLESKQTEVAIQHTRSGRTLVAVGCPIFDENGEINKVISLARDFSRQLQIGTLLSNIEKKDKTAATSRHTGPCIITCNEKMLKMVELANIVATVNSTVLITGETGTGKEVVAKYIYKSGGRADKPFIKVNCGAISPGIIESELFGYESGAFTGASKDGKIGLLEAANGGTLFLDEISELPYEQQVKLLQVLQERSMTRVGGTKAIELDIRVIAATNKNLENQIAKGEFREDLFYRLNVVPIYILPLRERIDDIPLLANHFLRVFNERYDKEMDFSQGALYQLSDYMWPGNVRELENTIERMIITGQDPFIDIDDLPEFIHQSTSRKADKMVILKKIMPLNEAIEIVEKKLIEMALAKYGSGKKAARALGVDPSTISRKIKRYKLAENNVN